MSQNNKNRLRHKHVLLRCRSLDLKSEDLGQIQITITIPVNPLRRRCVLERRLTERRKGDDEDVDDDGAATSTRDVNGLIWQFMPKWLRATSHSSAESQKQSSTSACLKKVWSCANPKKLLIVFHVRVSRNGAVLTFLASLPSPIHSCLLLHLPSHLFCCLPPGTEQPLLFALFSRQMTSFYTHSHSRMNFKLFEV